MDVSNIHWLGHASFMIDAGEKRIFIDPYQLTTQQKADVILITHSHYDHCSIADVSKIMKPETIILAPPDCTSKFAKITGGRLLLINPGDKKNLGGILVEAVPAYNTAKQFHPKENNWIGYLIDTGNMRVYHAGDTDVIPEMQNIHADVALLPIGGTYTMDYSQAAQACRLINPKVAIPMHWGAIVGDKTDAQHFKQNASCEVVILERG